MIMYSGRVLTVYELTDLFNMYIIVLDEGQHDCVLGRVLTVYELTHLFNMYIIVLDEGQHDCVLS